MSAIRTVILFVLVAVGTYWAWNHNPVVRNTLESVFGSGEFLTLEERFAADEIMESNQMELLGNDDGRAFLPPQLRFHPYLLLEVKYMGEQKGTTEGVVLWSLNDGEMVLNTETWETTHGFEDCLNAGANRNDFKVINALADGGGAMTKEALLKALNTEATELDEWLTSVQEKNLVVQVGSKYQLHFEQPRLNVRPQTRFSQRLVTKPYKHAKRLDRRYSRSNIEQNAQAAFGSHFAVRGHREVFLPVYQIDVKNPDGSVASTYWNALSGQRIHTLELR